MRRTITVVVALFALGFTGCKSAEQKSQDVAAQLQAVNDQYQKDCPKFDEHDTTGVQSALGQKATPEQQAAAAQRQRDIQARLNSPHCKELKAKLDDLYRKGMGLQSH